MQSHSRVIAVLFAILLLALGLRVAGIQYGLPYKYHVDEPTYVSEALNLGAGIIGKQLNPTGYPNILLGEFAAYYLFGRLTGTFSSIAAFEKAYRSDASVLLLFGRLTSVLLGTATVAVAYGLGRRIADRNTGLLAALFLAGSFLHVRDSHFGVPDVSTTFFVGLSVLLSLLAIETRAKKHFAWAASLGGYAIATKWNVGLVVIPLISAAVICLRPPSKGDKSRFERPILIFVAIFFLLGFALGGFQLMLEPTIFLKYALREARAGQAGGFGLWQIDTLPGWLFYLKTLTYGIGYVMLVLAVLGGIRRIFMVIRGQDMTSLLLISFPVLYFLTMGATRHYFARYAMPLVPFAAVLAADMIVATAARWRLQHGRLSSGLAIGTVLAAVIPTFVDCVQYDTLLSRDDTRTIAKQWIETNIVPGTKIAIDWPFHGPPLTPVAQPYLSGVPYNVTLVGKTGLSEHPLAWYRQQGYEYLIASSFIYGIRLVLPDRDAQRNDFYAQLPWKTKLTKEFYANGSETEPPFIFDEIYGPATSLWQRDRPGPTIKIYRLN